MYKLIGKHTIELDFIAYIQPVTIYIYIYSKSMEVCFIVPYISICFDEFYSDSQVKCRESYRDIMVINGHVFHVIIGIFKY